MSQTDFKRQQRILKRMNNETMFEPIDYLLIFMIMLMLGVILLVLFL